MTVSLTEQEKRTIRAVLGEVLSMSNINSFLGSITIEEASALYHKLKYEWYSDKYGVPYEEMTEADFIRAYSEENEC